MLADLKTRFEGIDKKRVYTAVAALVIAGAAGHFMQRTATTPGGGGQVLSASVPGSPQVTAPADAPRVVAAGMIDQAPTLPAAIMDLATRHDTIASPDTPSLLAATGAEAAEPRGSDEVAALDEAAPEVTRSSIEPFLAVMDASSGLDDPLAIPAQELSAAPDLTVDATEPAVAFSLAAADDKIELSTEPVPSLAGCAITLDAVAQAGALAAISLNAPCNAGEEVDFEHEGLQFSEQLGPNGDLFLLVPAMSQEAVFRVRLADGREAAAEVILPDFVDFERIALVWKGATGLQLHVLENGADYGDAGHIWAETPSSPDAAIAGQGGFVSVLGSTSAGYAADIYTYPARLFADGPEPVVSVEAVVMENTCATEIQGSILRTNARRAPTSQPLTMAVPGCDAVGEYLVLNNLPQDLKLARN